MLPLLLVAVGGTAVAAGSWSKKKLREHKDAREKLAASRAARKLHQAGEAYQNFVQDSFESVLGSKRKALNQEVSGERVEISVPHREINRRMGLSVLLAGAAGISKLYFPLIFVTAPFYALMLIPTYIQAYRDLAREKRITFDVLWAVFGTGIFFTKNFFSGAIAMCAGSVFKKIELSVEQQTRQQMSDVFGQQARTVFCLVDGTEVEIPVEQLHAGDHVMVHAGQTIPVDGTVVDGVGLVDQHRLTGESQPVEHEPGGTVFATTTLLTGKLRVAVGKAGKDTLAAEITRMLNDTTGHHLGVELKGKKLAEQTMTPALVGSLLLLPFLGSQTAVALLGSAMPGVELLIAGPIALLNFLNHAAECQILVKDGRSLELLDGVKQVVFDKTGTLTQNQPKVETIHCFAATGQDDVLRYAAAAERHQSHPIARAILAEALERGVSTPIIDAAQYEVGYGIQVSVPAGGRETIARVGSERYMKQGGIAIPEEFAEVQTRCDGVGHSLVFVALDGVAAGAIELAPTIRPEAKRVVDELHKRGLKVLIISGDQEGPTRKLAAELGVEHYHANVLPQGKADLVRELQESGGSLCFVGDGINDAIALKAAHVSVSLRGATTAATDTAQIVLMDESLDRLPLLLDLAKEIDGNLNRSFIMSAGGGYALMGSVLFLHVNVAGVLFFGYMIAAAVYANTMIPVMRWRREAREKKKKLAELAA
jgi:Cu2+-exporting ATPase